jgi:hypothetical protein
MSDTVSISFLRTRALTLTFTVTLTLFILIFISILSSLRNFININVLIVLIATEQIVKCINVIGLLQMTMNIVLLYVNPLLSLSYSLFQTSLFTICCLCFTHSHTHSLSFQSITTNTWFDLEVGTIFVEKPKTRVFFSIMQRYQLTNLQLNQIKEERKCFTCVCGRS